MNGAMPMDPGLMEALNAAMMQKMSPVGEMPVEKPQTQNKVPHDVMQKMLKARIYELSPDAEIDLDDIGPGLYR
jgi:hypothetical protein